MTIYLIHFFYKNKKLKKILSKKTITSDKNENIITRFG